MHVRSAEPEFYAATCVSLGEKMAIPWLSVLMPVHNGSTYLRSTLDSLIAATSDDVEVIAVDDASTDATAEILEEYRSRLDLSVYRNESNVGWTASTNRAMRLARGQYQCWLHQDDIWRSERLAVLKGHASKHPDSTLFLHPVRFIDSRGRRIGRWHCPLPPNRRLDPQFLVPRLLVQNFIATPAPLYRSDVVSAIGMLDETLWYTGDWDFWLRIAGAGTAVYCPQYLADFRVHPTSLTARRARETEEFRRQYDSVLRRHLDVPGDAEKERAARAARFSAVVNCELARWLGGEPLRLGRLAKGLIELGPAGWRRYFRDSRIFERTLSRVRAGALSSAAWRGDARCATSGGCDRSER